MVNAFSFCIYGTNDKYCRGLTENLKIISRDYPTYHTYIVAGNDVPARYIEEYRSMPSIHITLAGCTGGKLMTERFFIADLAGIDVCFFRDADSRINGRDSWCISEFLKSDRPCHIIRDHPYHARRIMGGMWAIKKEYSIDIMVIMLVVIIIAITRGCVKYTIYRNVLSNKPEVKHTETLTESFNKDFDTILIQRIKASDQNVVLRDYLENNRYFPSM